MKKFNFIFVLALLAGIGLSFTTVNNFTTNKAEFKASDGNWMTNFYRQDLLNNKNNVSAEEIQKFVDKNLVEHVHKCMDEHTDIFMTKCYSKLNAKLKYDDTEFNINYPIAAELILTECSQPERMAILSIDYKNKTIEVKESFRSPAVAHTDYISDICAYYKENSTKFPPNVDNSEENKDVEENKDGKKHSGCDGN